eukprot:4718611-Amphidinium_carterae.1
MSVSRAYYDMPAEFSWTRNARLIDSQQRKVVHFQSTSSLQPDSQQGTNTNDSCRRKVLQSTIP